MKHFRAAAQLLAQTSHASWVSGLDTARPETPVASRARCGLKRVQRVFRASGIPPHQTGALGFETSLGCRVYTGGACIEISCSRCSPMKKRGCTPGCGAWIETFLLPLVGAALKSHPCGRLRGLKSSLCTHFFPSREPHYEWRAWIETPSSGAWARNWVRGLKHRCQPQHPRVAESHPARGAWIETATRLWQAIATPAPPTGQRGLK